MGNNQSVDLKAFDNKQDIKNFISKVEQDNEKLETQLKDLNKKLEEKTPRIELNRFVEAYSEAECECNAPQFVFWLSKSKRESCKNAKTRAFSELINFVDVVTEQSQINSLVNDVNSRMIYLNSIKDTNKKYTE